LGPSYIDRYEIIMAKGGGRMPRARKGRVQIRFEILKYLYYHPEAKPRTHIWRMANTLIYDDFQQHLAYLIEKGLVAEQEGSECTITHSGRDIYE
jgi:predicted transcriptional regulator